MSEEARQIMADAEKWRQLKAHLADIDRPERENHDELIAKGKRILQYIDHWQIAGSGGRFAVGAQDEARDFIEAAVEALESGPAEAEEGA